jgi:hypothetical protein
MLEEYFSRIAKGCYRTSSGEIISTAQIRRGVQPQTIVRSRALTPAAQILAALLNRCVREFRPGISDSPMVFPDIGKIENEKPRVNLSQRSGIYCLLFLILVAPISAAVPAESGTLRGGCHQYPPALG